MTYLEQILSSIEGGLSPEVFLISLIPSVAIALVGFIFSAIAIYVMSKRRGLKNKAFAFIPFLQYLQLGKLVGECSIFGKKIKNIGLWAFIVSLLSFLLNLIYNLGFYIDLIAYVFDVSITFNSQFIQDFLFTDRYESIYAFISMISSVVDIVFIFFDVTIIFQIFRRYAPQKATIYAIISIFIEFMFGILLFTVRNNNPVNYQTFNRARYYYYNPNDDRRGGGYNNPYNNNPYNNQEQNNKPQNPFPEFSEDDDFSSGSGNSSGSDDYK